MHTISANELKTRGVTALEEGLKNDQELIISVHGKNRFVVIPIKAYQHMRELELQQALIESQQDLKQGKYHTDIKKHIKQLKVKA